MKMSELAGPRHPLAIRIQPYPSNGKKEPGMLSNTVKPRRRGSKRSSSSMNAQVENHHSMTE